ncbi:MAG: M36 family metallopeptidase, partial [Actinomycetota bacterium]
MRRIHVRSAILLALLAGLAVPVRGSAVTAPAPGSDAIPYDARDGAAPIAPGRAQVDAMGTLVDRHHDVKIRWNARFGTPSSILRWGATLTAAAPGRPVDIARAWLRDHAALFGWTAGDAGALRTVKVLRQPGSGPVGVLFHQRFGALEGNALGGSVMIALDRSNRIVSVRANVVRVPRLATGRRLTAAAAFTRVAGTAAPAIAGHKGEWMIFRPGGRAFNHFARRVAFPLPHAPARPAWEVIWVKGLAEGQRVVVDAVTGDILHRVDAVRFEAPEGRVFLNYPGAPGRAGTHDMQSFAGDPQASPEGWLNPVAGDAPGFTTAGNNATTATNWGVFIAPDGPGQVRPISPDAVFDDPFSDAWALSRCGRNEISAQTRTADSPTYALDALPAVTNLFFHHNIAHDFWYRLGFDEEAGAMQANNFGAGDPAKQGDPLIGLVQAGAVAGDVPGATLGRDNAYMFSNPDGLPSWSGMFLFEPIPGALNAPCTDGDFDAHVIYHEYAHGVTSRWVGGESGNLDTYHGGSMGESWGDFYGLHYLFRHRLEKTDGLGPYVTGSQKRGIRNFPMSAVPVGFGDLGYDVGGEEVHSDGEIWNGVLWDIRTTLARANKSGPNAGADLASQLIADAMPISGPLPDMLDMRNAILAADTARTEGASQALLWEVFARRGMGASAFSKDAGDINPRPAFDHKDSARNGRVNGVVVDAATKKPIAGARVFLSEYEARTSPLTRTGSDGSFSMLMQGGRYRATIQAQGYGSHPVALTVKPKTVSRRRVEVSLNYASSTAGAEVVDASNLSSLGAPALALDDSGNTVWISDTDADGPEEWFVVDLAGSRPVEIQAVRFSALPLPGFGRFNAMRRWTLETSLDGEEFEPVASGEFRPDRLRPLAPNVNYRTWKLREPVRAAFVRVTATPMDNTSTRVQIADFQVFGKGEP